MSIAAVEVVLPFALGRALDAVVGAGAPGWWLTLTAGLLAVLVACDALDDLVAGAATARSTAWLRHAMLGHVLDAGSGATGRLRPGDLASRLVGNAAEVGRVAPTAVRLGANLIPGAGGIVALALIDPWLCLTFLAGLPLLLVVVRRFSRRATDLATLYLEAQGRIAARLVGALSGIRTIAAAGAVEREAERVLSPLPELRRHGVGTWRTQMGIGTQQALVVSLLEISVLAVAGVELARGRMTAGEMLAAGQYVLLAASLGSAAAAVIRIATLRAAAGRAAEVLGAPAPPYGGAHLPGGRGRLELRDVSAGGDGDRALTGIDLVVPAGALIALVGRSGSGKSLLAGLAGRLADPDRGQVLLDGVPLWRLDRAELRREVGYGFERPALFGETPAQAIAFGAWSPPPGDVVAAARAARADGFIRRLPGGYETPLAAAPLSGGEAQRLGLARTFAHAGRVVILDDVAASLDTVTEHHISQVLTGALADRTRIIVAHRASTAARADQVVWLERGRIRAVAPHHELWRDPGYRALFEAAERPGPPVTAAVDGAARRPAGEPGGSPP